MTIQDHAHEHHPKPLEPFRRRLAARKGKDLWRSLNELANSEEFEQLVREEFPRQASLLGTLSRRDFLKVLGASLALAGLASCAPQPQEKILPYTRPPEEVIPGKSVYYASTMVQDGYGKGVLIETTMGRPIKVEGNPRHPSSLGATDIFMQASILELYDPDRAKQVLNQGQTKTWDDFIAAVGQAGGPGLRILTGPVTSPTLINQITGLVNQFQGAKWYQHSPVWGAGIAGEGPIYDFSKADVVLSLDCDFMFTEPGHIRYSRDFQQRHQPISTNGVMNRLYVVEPSLTLTGSNADHRLAVKPSQVEAFARALAARLGVSAAGAAGEVPGQNWLEPLAADLQRAGANALVIAGQRQPPAVHALAMAINQALGSVGTTVHLLPGPGQDAVIPDSNLAALVDELNGNQVSLLVILEGNPVYSAPADLDFATAMQKAGQSVYLAAHLDETAALATWVIPAAHYMEMWGDARAYDGTASIIQPVIEPLYGGKSPYELLAAVAGQGSVNGYDVVRAYWQGQAADNFEREWREWLSQGVIPNTAAQPNAGAGGAPEIGPAPSAAEGLEIVFQPDDTIWDGRFSNNAWLQELPKQLSKLTWDNAAFISPATAARLQLEDGDVVTLRLRGRSVDAPILRLPGQPDDVVAVTLGYGRAAGGSLAQGSGYNAYAIRTSQAPWFDSGLEVSKTGRTHVFALTQDHWAMEGRHLVQSATLEEYQAHPNFAKEEEEHTPGGEDPITLYGEVEYPGYAWGMAINLNTCIGCNACVVACQAENNIPTVGKQEVIRGREMHWLRIDRYYEGRPENPKVYFQPVPCMHCEKAPCEPVCPVQATSHSAEGINEMTYNRCVGTKYCSNNCPYKVRRFNFFKYVDENVVSLRAMRNPDVTVRSRGVMEKCTYCVQRVNQARIQAELEGRTIQDGEVMTACQQACPTGAIVFGNINDAGSAVRQLKDTPLNYGLLSELGTRPRTTYLAKVKNTNPMIKEEEA